MRTPHRLVEVKLLERIDDSAAPAATDSLWGLLDQASQLMMKHAQRRGNITVAFGHVAQLAREVEALRQLVLQTIPNNQVTVACEMGFNAGHSAIVWLQDTPVRILNTFDTFALPYSEPTRRFVASLYPGRVRFIPGNTKVTVPLYNDAVRRHDEEPCDLWFVDGDHYKNVYLDFRNALASSRDGTLFVVDDTTDRFPFVLEQWRRAVQQGNVTQLSCANVTLGPPVINRRGQPEPNVKGWCVGRVWKPAIPLAGRVQ